MRATEKLISSNKNPTRRRAQVKKDPNTLKLEREISDTLGTTVEVNVNKKGAGKLIINFNNLDQLQGILKKIKTKKTH